MPILFNNADLKMEIIIYPKSGLDHPLISIKYSIISQSTFQIYVVPPKYFVKRPIWLSLWPPLIQITRSCFVMNPWVWIYWHFCILQSLGGNNTTTVYSANALGQNLILSEEEYATLTNMDNSNLNLQAQQIVSIKSVVCCVLCLP